MSVIIENLIKKRKIAWLILFFILCGQLVYSFLFPAYPISSDYWKTMEELNFYKGYSFSSFDNLIAKKIYPLLSNYHINSDAGGEILLAHDFPQHYFRGHLVRLPRPLYAFSIYLISLPLHLISNSYSLTFAAGIFFNFVLFFFTTILFYLLVEKFISARVALLSSILLVLSPFAHIWLVQPEASIFGAFAVILSLYLLQNYINYPNFKKLIIFSLAIGFLMLGKWLFAISIFILILAVYFKRYKEGILFFIIHLIPLVFWYFLVTKVFRISFFSQYSEFTDYQMGIWVFNIFHWPWQKTFQIFLSVLPRFFYSVIYGFLLFPVIFSLIGFKNLSLRKKPLFCFSFIFSFLVLFFFMNYYAPRLGFLLFPVIYPLTVLGIDRTADFFKRYINPKIFYLVTYIFLIIISNVNIFKIFPYDGNLPWFQ